MPKRYIAEFIGTFALSFGVYVALASKSIPVAVPVIAALVLMLFVYLIGHVSGCHINPAVTIGQLSIKKIPPKEALLYIVSQVLGAIVAFAVARYALSISFSAVLVPMTGGIFFAEVLGAFFFNFGISAVVFGKVKDSMSGIVVGGSLLFGLIVSSSVGALGILNPAVAVALGAASIVYIVAPVIGAVLGVWAYKYVAE